MKKNFILPLLTLLSVSTITAQTKFDAKDEENLIAYEVPEWYQDAKIGYWAVWGLYSVPAFGTEWYGRCMYSVDPSVPLEAKYMYIADHHRKTYGDPSEFGYKDFIPMFKAEKFDADEWLDFCVDGGAKFFTMIGIFHDNFCMWDSESNPFNTYDMGPNRDFVAELKEATKARGLRFGVSNHSAYNGDFFEFNHKYGFDAKDPATHGLYGTGSIDQAAVDRWWKQTVEMADKYQPDLYYFDWGWNRKPYEYENGNKRKDFLEYYYNAALEWNKEKYPTPDVVVNYKIRGKLPYGSAVLDLERGGMSEIEKEVWQNDTAIGTKSWSYVPDEEFRSSNQIIDMLLDIISKNGVLMLCFGPNADGSIPSEAKETISKVGDWLKINGEAVYATRPWTQFGEGVTVPDDKLGGDEVDYVAEDVRFTRSKDNTTLYISFLGYPDGGEGIVKLLKSNSIDLSSLEIIELLGSNAKVKLNQKVDGLHIKLPKSVDKDNYAYSLKLKFNGDIPQLK